MRSTVIHALPGWQVTSWGNGMSYELVNKRTAQSVFFRGDDAAIFRDSLGALTEPRGDSYANILNYSDALGCIWSDYAECASDWGVRD